MSGTGLPQGGRVDDRYATWDAAYVLGALPPDEQREYEDHLRGCDRCRAAVDELRDIPPLLGQLDRDDLAVLEETPDPRLLDALLADVRARRRRARWLTLATTAVTAVAAAVLAVGLVLLIGPADGGGHEQAGAPTLEMTKVSDTPINASIGLTSFGWGTRIDMACSYGDWGRRDAPPQNLGMVVVARDGSTEQVATWLGLSGATALPSATTPLRRDEIAAVQLVTADTGRVLLERRL